MKKTVNLCWLVAAIALTFPTFCQEPSGKLDAEKGLCPSGKSKKEGALVKVCCETIADERSVYVKEYAKSAILQVDHRIQNMPLPEGTPVDTLPTTEPEIQNQLRELTAQSWNLELIVSGAAMFATLSLPDLLESALTYYRYNLMTDADLIHEMMPAEMFGIMKGACYVLFGAFLANFVMRAFWIGLVGLLAVYPDGIRYDRVYKLSRYAQQRLAGEMGTLSDYIIRLDKRCNVVFALAFSLVFFLFGIAGFYALFVLIEASLQLLVPDHLYETVRTIVGWVLVSLVSGFILVYTILNLPRFRDDDRFAPIAFRMSEGFSIIFLGLYRPAQYISLTFTSQIPQKILQKRYVWIIGLGLAIEIVFMTGQLVQIRNASDLFDSRSFMSTRDPNQMVDVNAFDNLRTPDQLIDNASIQSDVIREPYIRLFLSYPKVLDSELTKRFKEPQWPDNLSKKEKREKRAAWYLKSLESYFGVYVNDSLYRAPGFLFTQRADNGQRGLATVLMTNGLKAGRNLLRITVPDSANKPQPYYQIPFWYVPEN
ncbi:hypothetical protein [Spirosoma panaciterrae]|uniref:hypothetical protein n=1 Tax=Spirosoma panaciterrae TaxID=496058 RepID=UPI0003798CAA|nr:hypothetical protein [Spirosoma panaciterrae]